MSPFAQSARSPSSTPHSHQCWGLLCSSSRPQTPEQRPQTSTQQHTGAPSTTAPSTIISLFSNFSLSNILDFKMASLNGSCFFPLLPPTTKMLIASQSQSLKSLTYCVDSIPSLLPPFMWVLMYCHVSAL